MPVKGQYLRQILPIKVQTIPIPGRAGQLMLGEEPAV
jgi:hypothetical protein